MLVWSDNIAIVQIISGLSSKDPLLTHLLRLLYFFLAVHTIKLQAKHIPGVHNTVVDALSRNQLSVFFQLHPAASRTPTAIPDQLTTLIGSDCEVWQSLTLRELLRASSRTV